MTHYDKLENKLNQLVQEAKRQYLALRQDIECLYNELFRDYFRINDEARAERLKQMEENYDK